MDRDRSLFRDVKEGSRGPVVRLFSWRRTTVSYGRTQGIDNATVEQARLRSWDLVQRPTGGGKVIHENDICFSILWMRQDRAIPWKVLDSYRVIHGWIGRCLEELDFPIEKAAMKSGDGRWCFQSPACFDILSDGKKIVGGAQWRDGNAAIHQGSIQVSIPPDRLGLFKESFESEFDVAFRK